MSYVYTLFTYHAACHTWYILMYLCISSSNSRKKTWAPLDRGQNREAATLTLNDANAPTKRPPNTDLSWHKLKLIKMGETPWGRLKKKRYDAGLNNAQRFRGYNKIPFGSIWDGKKVTQLITHVCMSIKRRRHFFSILDFPHAGSIHHWRWNHTTFPHAGRAKLGQSLQRLTYKDIN